MLTKTFALKLAAIDDAGSKASFKGVAAPYSTPDEAGDVLRPGLFAKSIRDAEGTFPCLWGHRMDEPLGSITIESSDTKSLNVSGLLLVDDVAKAREVHALMKAKAIRGLSVGFIPLRYQPHGDGFEHIEARLCEISLCSVPSFRGAKVTEVKSLDALVAELNRDELLTLRKSLDTRLGGDGTVEATRLVEALGVFNSAKWR